MPLKRGMADKESYRMLYVRVPVFYGTRLLQFWLAHNFKTFEQIS